MRLIFQAIKCFQRIIWGVTHPSISICIVLATLLHLTFTNSSVSIESQRGIEARSKLIKDSGKSIGTYRALIIGINDYKDKKLDDLQTAVNDGRSIAAILKSDYGFSDVKLLLNNQATSSNIQKELRRLASQSNENDSVLNYYAGHGDLDRITKNGWWLPHNAIAQDPSTYIDNTIIQNYIRAMPARHVLLVSDSCFSGTLFGQSRSVPPVIDDKYYAALFKEKSRWGITSGNLTPVTDTGTGGHSLFAYQFIKSLNENNKPYLTPREIYQDIAPIISNNSEQIPIAKPIRNTDDQGGEFIFIRTKSSVASIPSTQTTTTIDIGEKQKLLDAERKALEAERQSLDAEKKLIEEQQKLAEERHKLEAEKESIKKEREKVASLPKINKVEKDAPIPATQASRLRKVYSTKVETTNLTDIYINIGEEVEITASGTIKFGFFAGSGGPNGINGFNTYNKVSGARHGALTARVSSGNWREIGEYGKFIARKSGWLELMVNDSDVGNNMGYFEVKIVVTTE